MEIIRQLLSERHDYLQALRSAPPATKLPLSSVTPATFPVPIPPASVQIQPVAAPPVPAPSQPGGSSVKPKSNISTRTLLKWIAGIAILAGIIYYIRRVEKKEEEKPR